MPVAICKSCGKRKHWRNQRGTRLKDIRCECGGELRRRTTEEIDADAKASWEEYLAWKKDHPGYEPVEVP